ncbi:hypothetical protein ElyMa_001447000 [Elysia marginata]|uniref:Uncharacterized protein n=1 Tax=Elysia marginata TaxID=1093978 RepID=A0AAV4J3W1_9GAST|nr:hypothetical protein ElyMa_001447000 [Elysia marginata]
MTFDAFTMTFLPFPRTAAVYPFNLQKGSAINFHLVRHMTYVGNTCLVLQNAGKLIQQCFVILLRSINAKVPLPRWSGFARKRLSAKNCTTALTGTIE